MWSNTDQGLCSYSVAKEREKLAELQVRFMKEAERNKVLPVNNRTVNGASALDESTIAWKRVEPFWNVATAAFLLTAPAVAGASANWPSMPPPA